MSTTKTFPAKVKAVSDGDGIVEALVATYDVDSGGDQIVPGAFAKTLQAWADSGNPIPFIWSHMHSDIDAYLGSVLEAKEIDEGLWVKAQLDMEDDKARKAHRQIKSGRVNNYSFAYDIGDAEEKDGVYLLKELHLFEVGPTLIGMNQATRTLAVKAAAEISAFAAAVKAGRVLSSKNETTLREAKSALDAAAAQIEGVLAAVAVEANDQGKANGPGPAKDEEPPGAKSEEPDRGPSARNLATLSILSLNK